MRVGFQRTKRPSREVGFPLTRRADGVEVRRSCESLQGLSGRTTIVVHLELGTNNALFVRGRGGVLSWDSGQPLLQLERGTWVWSTDFCTDPVEFQLLLNDTIWERNQPRFLEPGHTIRISPDFEWPEMPRVSSPPNPLQTIRGAFGLR